MKKFFKILGEQIVVVNIAILVFGGGLKLKDFFEDLYKKFKK